MDSSEKPPSDAEFREACYYFEQTSLDGAAHDFANDHEAPDVKDLALRVVKTGLHKFCTRISDMTEEDVKYDTMMLHEAQNIHLDRVNLNRSITLGDALDIIERAMEGKSDLAQHLEQRRDGIETSIDNLPNLRFRMPPPNSPDSSLDYNASILTNKHLAIARNSIYRRGLSLAKQSPYNSHSDVNSIRLFPDIVYNVHEELAKNPTDAKLRALSDLIKVVDREFQESIVPCIPKPDTHMGR